MNSKTQSFTLPIISQNSSGTCRSNPSSQKTTTRLSYTVNAVMAEDLTTNGTGVPFQYPIRRLIVRSREWPRTLYYHGIGSMIAEYSLSNNIPGYFRMNFLVECVFKNSITLNQRYLGKSETKPLAKMPEHRYGNRHLKTMNRYSLWNNLLS